MAAPTGLCNKILETFNSFHPRLQFMIEIGGEKINFLDITLIKNDTKINIDWYHKPTFSGRYLNYLSLHPITQKRGTIMGMVDRAFLLSHPQYHQKNLSFIIETLLNNDYPLDFIFETVNVRLRSLCHKKTLKQNTSDLDETPKKTIWYTIPYVPNISERLIKTVRHFDVRPAFFSLNKLDQFIRAQKDCLPNNKKKNVVYKIRCNDCDASYVGQTRRLLKTRISEHRNDIRKSTGNPSVISEHRMLHSHDFNWDNVEILDNEMYLNKRLISEMLFIKLQTNSLNSQTDTDFLHNGYLALLNKIKD